MPAKLGETAAIWKLDRGIEPAYKFMTRVHAILATIATVAVAVGVLMLLRWLYGT